MLLFQRLTGWRNSIFGISIILAIVTLLQFFFSIKMDQELYETPSKPELRLEYSSVAGFFQQDDPTTDPAKFDWATRNLGLIDRSYPTDGDLDGTTTTQWQRFEHYVRVLNAGAPGNTEYKVLFLGRHGEGYHNVAEAYYGTKAWDEYWSKLDGNGTISWADAHLTETGIKQALTAHAFWAKALKEDGIPAPESYYVSPLDRCCHTADLTFSGLELPEDRPFAPVIKELVREDLGEHTCDRRSTKTEIAARWPKFTFEEGFSEKDELWVPDERETAEHLVKRLKSFIDDVFESDGKLFISVTAHSGAIGGALVALGHRRFPLQTGGIITVLVKAEKIPAGSRAATSL